MSNILSVTSPSLEYAQILTWIRQSHYIGNLWLEQNNDTGPYNYANQEIRPHAGLGDLISSFAAAFRNGDDHTEMVPQNGQTVVGALSQGGCQLLEDLDASGTVQFSATGEKCVEDDCLQGFYNMNYQVLPLKSGLATSDEIDCESLLLSTTSAGDVWYYSQAGLALEYEAVHWDIHDNPTDIDSIFAGIAAAAFMILGGGAAALPPPADVPAEAFTGVVGGLFGPGNCLTNRLNTGLQQFTAGLLSFTNVMFTTGDLSDLPPYVFDNDATYKPYYTTMLANFFAAGKFAGSSMNCSTIGGPLNLVLQQSLVGYMLASANVYILANAYDAGSDCDKAAGYSLVLADSGSSAEICYVLLVPGPGEDPNGVPNDDRSDSTEAIPADLITLMQSDYQINIPQLIQSSLSFQVGTNEYGASFDFSTAVVGSYSMNSLPPCFYNVPVLFLSPIGGNVGSTVLLACSIKIVQQL
ncbi:uncharacterized protein PAC_07922 [Phialocephala subalpina]|uniref:Uncharacterized protein n=1 Tax=Phialocephala subalpina TaxID=576137 RepID=A0A1L7WZ49_9HELO|nr:uncharacterized protein PAC_07922 [Phialocephala subalpina]